MQKGIKNQSKIYVKSMQKKACKKYCRRGASPPHPLDTSRWKQIDQRQEIGRYWRYWRKKEAQKHAKIITIWFKWQPKSMKNQWKIEVESRMRFWIVLGWPWDAKWSILGAKTFKISSKWRPKSLQNRWKFKLALQMRFWSVFGSPKGSTVHYFPDQSGSHFP